MFRRWQNCGRFLPGVAVLLVLSGCAGPKKKPLTLEFDLQSPYRHVRTWAVAPVINLSGRRSINRLKISDEVFEELQQVRQLNVLPVDKSLLAMQELGLRGINSAKSAEKIAEVLHADGIVVVAITAYNPYKPLRVGMDMQVYDVRKARAGVAPLPAAQVSAMFDSANRSVREELKGFATGRSGGDHTLGWRRYLLETGAYMRFVCHAMIRRLLLQVQAGRTIGR